MKGKIYFGLILLTLVGVLLSACASTTGTDSVDQGPQSISEEKTIYVGPVLVDCQGEGPQQCMLIRDNPEDE